MMNLEKFTVQELMELRMELKGKMMNFSLKLTREDEKQLGQDIDTVEQELSKRINSK